MKIAMLGHKGFPSRDGGVEVVVGELATRMAALGHDVSVYNRTKEGEKLGFDGEYQGVKSYNVKTIDAKGLAATTASYFAAKEAVKDNPDVVHFHAEGPCMMIPIAKRAGIKTVATIHGLDWQRAKWGKLASAVIKLGEKRAAKYADEIIVLSKQAQKYFKEEYGRDTTLIPNGIEENVSIEANAINEKFGLEKDSYFLFVGRIVPEKAVDKLVKAFKKVNTDKKLVIAGSSSDSEDFYNDIIALAKDDDRVIFTGFAEGRMLSELYSNAYAYVLPSDLEGMPMTLLEAMSYGICCIVSDIPECSDVVGDSGIVFNRDDPEALTAILQVVADDQSVVVEYSLRAKSAVRNAFDWDDITEKTLALYKD